jgi:hypothetical protein
MPHNRIRRVSNRNSFCPLLMRLEIIAASSRANVISRDWSIRSGLFLNDGTRVELFGVAKLESGTVLNVDATSRSSIRGTGI